MFYLQWKQFEVDGVHKVVKMILHAAYGTLSIGDCW
jgi:hypothetical protein